MSREARMADLTRDLRTVSERIRKLDAAGFTRSEIARFLGKRYQHVRNVLVADVRPHPEGTGADRAGQEVPERLDVRVGPSGRIVIPVAFRAAMGIGEGDTLIARVVDGELRLISPAMAVRRAQRAVRDLIPGDDSLVDILLENRRREVADKSGDGRRGS